MAALFSGPTIEVNYEHEGIRIQLGVYTKELIFLTVTSFSGMMQEFSGLAVWIDTGETSMGQDLGTTCYHMLNAK